jgi:histone deacetylase 6
MPLTICNNVTSFDRGHAPPESRHLGTRDRDNPTNRFDFPGKALALSRAAIELKEYVNGKQGSTTHGPQLRPIKIVGASRVAEEGDLLKVHTEAYLSSLKTACELSRQKMRAGEDPFITFGEEADVTPGTYEAARCSVGAAFDAADIALQTKDATAFALVWPPGHHAEPDRAMGFCYLSTAALSALYARDHAVQMRPGNPNKVVVIDIDHHRGNGTAASIANKEGVFFVDLVYRSPYDSVARAYSDNAREYPYVHDDVSRGIKSHPVIEAPNIKTIEFEGFQKSSTIVERFIAEALPRIREFNPDIVVWSVGLDSARGDPLGGLGLLPSAFYTLIKGIRLMCPEARHCGVLEGGYEQRLGSRCLKPALMAFHDELQDSRSQAFRKYRPTFSPHEEK